MCAVQCVQRDHSNITATTGTANELLLLTVFDVSCETAGATHIEKACREIMELSSQSIF